MKIWIIKDEARENNIVGIFSSKEQAINGIMDYIQNDEDFEYLIKDISPISTKDIYNWFRKQIEKNMYIIREIYLTVDCDWLDDEIEG